MLNLLPFAGRRRSMCHGDGELLFIREFLELLFPEAISHSMRTTICSNHTLCFVGRERFLHCCHHLLMLSTANAAGS